MSEQKQYLDLVEGQQTVFVRDITWDRDNNGAVVLKLNLASSNAPDAPWTNYKINCASPKDSQYVRMTKDKVMQMIMYPLADLAPSTATKFSDLVMAVKANLQKADIKSQIGVTINEGKMLDKKTGEPVKFANITAFKALEAIAKTPYQSPIQYDDDLPF